ncbi:hypothetical protein [Streptomyces hoynatensis]|uniref:hypothetical protein n=1 Tax=Streptomyces hoynatensis TaxID=1141874 RepID=UPI001319F5FD|nr:hypothetical protein [Streptomyces hoynatensis]
MEKLFLTQQVPWAVTLLAGVLAGVLRAWLAHRTAVRREVEHTRRVELAVRRTSGADRAAVIRAAGHLAPGNPRRRA